jgi:ABC-2 type transport system ATP-binding protein
VAQPAIHAEGLHRRFGATEALRGLDLEVAEGTVLALLGPNGAGKTTAVRVLTTLLRADAGSATVTGLDVVRDADRLRARIGLTGQYAAVDERLTGRENLEMFGRLYGLRKADARRRADELLERFALTDAANRTAKTYSGGMRRRLDLAASLIVSPPVIFLDEPTTGLDPRSRLGVWQLVNELVREGATLLLTTQYLEEADHLSDRIAVMDHGRVIAEGTADALKGRVGGERIEVLAADASRLGELRHILAAQGCGECQVDEERGWLAVPVMGGTASLANVMRDLDAARLPVSEIGLRRPTLDDVFLALTGHSAEDQTWNGKEAG